MEGNSTTLLSHKRSQIPEWGPPLGDPWAPDAADQATVAAPTHSNFPTYGEVRIGSLTFQPHPDLDLRRRQTTTTVSPEVGRELEDWEQVSLEHEFGSLCHTLPAQEPDVVTAETCDEARDADASEATVSVDTAPTIADDASPSQPTTLQEQLRSHFATLQQLSKRAALGDDVAVGEIQSILNDNEELWHYLGDVELSTEAMLIEFLSGPAAVKESVRRRVIELKRSLAGDNPTPLERLAVGRVAACWLFTQFVERWCGHAVKASGRTTGLATLLEAGEKRLQTAIKSLKLARGIRS